MQTVAQHQRNESIGGLKLRFFFSLWLQSVPSTDTVADKAKRVWPKDKCFVTYIHATMLNAMCMSDYYEIIFVACIVFDVNDFIYGCDEAQIVANVCCCCCCCHQDHIGTFQAKQRKPNKHLPRAAKSLLFFSLFVFRISLPRFFKKFWSDLRV